MFENLPTELQWEILTEFVGTHVVRNNKLIRRMDGKIQKKLVECAKHSHLFDHPKCYLKQKTYHFGNGNMPWYWQTPYDQSVFKVTEVSLYKNETVFALVENIRTGEMIHSYYSSSNKMYTCPVDDSVTLLPYAKHNYPSYPYTNKKLKRTTGLKVILY